LRKRIKPGRFGVLAMVGLIAAAIAATAAFANAITGPSSSQSPYVLRSQPGVVTKAILTVGDSVDDYKMVGIPDGLGAFDNGDGTFTLLMNHELGGGSGAVRAHGSTGAFVSKWTIEKDTLRVLHGEDLIQHVDLAGAGSTLPLSRLCSADLAPINAYYNVATARPVVHGRRRVRAGRSRLRACTGR
jgi:hypothetical protein